MAVFLATGSVLAFLAGSVWVYSWQLPPPERANRQELLRWLVTRDLSVEPAHTRDVLARRLDSEFVDVDWKELSSQMNEEHRRQLWKNLPLLLDLWFVDKFEAYSNSNISQRPAFIDGIVDRMVELSGIDCLSAADSAGNSPSLMRTIAERIAICKKQALPKEREQMGQFTSAIQSRWLIRALSGEIPQQVGQFQPQTIAD